MSVMEVHSVFSRETRLLQHSEMGLCVIYEVHAVFHSET